MGRLRRLSISVLLVVLCVTVLLSGCSRTPYSEEPSSEAVNSVVGNSSNSPTSSESVGMPNGTAFFKLISTKVYEDYEANYSGNSKLERNIELIYGQASCPNFAVGNSNAETAGCEIIAVYNALRLCGFEATCSGVIRDFEKNGYLMAAGHFGSNPYLIKDYFENKRKHPITQYADFSSMTKDVTDNIYDKRVYIASFWNSNVISDGFHTVAFYTDKGSIYILNLGINDIKLTMKSRMEAFVKEERFIVGYWIPVKESD